MCGKWCTCVWSFLNGSFVLATAFTAQWHSKRHTGNMGRVRGRYAVYGYNMQQRSLAGIKLGSTFSGHRQSYLQSLNMRQATSNLPMLELGVLWLSKTDKLTLMPTSCSDWLGVQRCERRIWTSLSFQSNVTQLFLSCFASTSERNTMTAFRERFLKVRPLSPYLNDYLSVATRDTHKHFCLQI